MKSAIYSPYLDALGGGERYIMTIAEYLCKKGSVDIFWHDQAIKQKIIDRFGLDVASAKIIPDKLSAGSALHRFQVMKSYDVFVLLSDGSFPYGFAKKNILHFQTPLQLSGKRTIVNKLKLSRWKVVVNSQFTKSVIDQTYGVESQVLYPPVDVDAFHSTKKENCIITVGRFHGGIHGKKQEVLIDAFKKMYDDGREGWQLIVAGSVENREFFDQLQSSAKGYPILFAGDVSFEELIKLYAKAKIYWHAQGFGETEPQYMEHFGMTTVEAMAAGCVPVVFNGGGQREIVETDANGELWTTTEELIAKTKLLMENKDKYAELSQNAIEKSKQFSKENFYKKLDSVLSPSP